MVDASVTPNGAAQAAEVAKQQESKQTEPIGRTSATEREPITSEKFAFWVPEGVILNPFDIVSVQQVNRPEQEPS